jgi:hypothetical protein
MSDSSQAFFNDPSLAIQTATMPPQTLQTQDASAPEAQAKRGGFLHQTLDWFGKTGKTVDGALQKVGVGGYNASNALHWAWTPVDKTASGARWIYSNGISQPISTVLLQAATSEGSQVDTNSYFSASDWAKNWHAANKMSPGQVIENTENTLLAQHGADVFGFLSGNVGLHISPEEKAQVKRQSDRFIYDTDYWKSKAGWKYDVGSGTLDFMLNMGADPVTAAGKFLAPVVKGARSIKVAEEAQKTSKSISGVNRLAESAGNALGARLAKTPEQATQSKKIQDFFEWTQKPGLTGDRKTQDEIAQHPIWGRGRRKMEERHQLSSLLSQADNVEQPLILGMAMGSQSAAQQLAVKNTDLLTQIGRMQDNRKLLDSVKYDPLMMTYAMRETRAGRESLTSGKEGMFGNTSASTKSNEIKEPPFPRPTAPGPRQSGWDATYGKRDVSSRLYRSLANEMLKGSNGVRPAGIGNLPDAWDGLRFQNWKMNQADLMDRQLQSMSIKDSFYRDILGKNWGKGVEEFSPGESNLFGQLKTLYRAGPLGVTDLGRAADRKFGAAIADRNAPKGQFTSRYIRNGYYSIPVKVIQTLGDELPQTLINHNASDASDRFLDMLKKVPDLGPEARAGMLNQYTIAGDKTTRSRVMETINSQIVSHMAGRYNVDDATARVVAQMIKDGTDNAMNTLSGKAAPSKPIYTAATNQVTGVRADMIEDGAGLKAMPQAATQLAYSEPLLNVKEVEAFLKSHSGYLQTLRRGGMQAKDVAFEGLDGLSNIWKAATLIRPGQMLRSPSEEMAAGAIKFGLFSSIMMSAHGGKNWTLNRTHQLEALVGKGDYASAVGGKTRVRVTDPGIVSATKARRAAGQKTAADKLVRINVGKAYPIVMARIDSERELLSPLEEKIAKMKKDPKHDPNELYELEFQAEEHADIIKEHRDYADAIVSAAVNAKGIRVGEGTIEHAGHTIPQAFSPEWEHPIPRDEVTSDYAKEAVFGRGESIDTSRLVKTGKWVGVTPGQPNHMKSWLDALNNQFRQDPLFRLVAEDPSFKKAGKWLNTTDGKYHLSLLGKAGLDRANLLQGISDTLDQYAPTAMMRNNLANNELISEAEIKSQMSAEDYPTVHGEEVLGLTGKGHMSTTSALMDGILKKGYRLFQSIPTDILSRHPAYVRASDARLRILLDEEVGYQKSVGKSGQDISKETLNAMLQKADRQARHDISTVVFDPKRTTATQALRFIYPFLGAHIDGLERWGGLIAEKPELVGQASKIYGAPVAANLVTDPQGNHVDSNGYATVTDENGKSVRKFVGLQDRVLHLKVPDGTKNMPGKNRFDIPIKLQALNTILPGDPWFNPGTGPVVQVAASQLAVREPAMGDFLQWAKVLPYGPGQGGILNQVQQAFTPKYMSEAFTAFHTDDVKFQETVLQEYQRQVAEYHKGGDAPDINKARKQAKDFYFLKAFTSWMSPAQNQTTPLTGTPYQFYVDQYKKLQQADPKSADDQFLAKYGEDYFVFTASLSKSMGIAPTLSALNSSKMYKDEIAGDTSLAPFIIGDIYNKGNFSSSAYAAEKNMTIGGEKVRSTQSVEDALAENQTNLGWAEYGKLMNGLDAALIRTGFHSYTQSGAQNFLQIKQNIQGYLTNKYPSWEEAFDTTDRGLVPRRIKSFETLVQDPKLAGDPMRQDIPALRNYLIARQQFKQQLESRGAKTLSFDLNGMPTGQNADLGQAWRDYQGVLKSQNTMFADVFNRYLSNDDLQ